MVSNENFIRQAKGKRDSLTRYNQGFLKFGPMEQAEDGEWVEAEPALLLLTQCLTELELNDTDIEDLHDYITMLKSENKDLRSKVVVLGIEILLCIAIMFYLGVVHLN